MQTLPKTHPLATLGVRETRRYLSPLTKLALAHDGTAERMEMIEPYALPPWHRHMVVEYDSDKEAAVDADTGGAVPETSSMRQVLIATNASARNGIVGMGGVVRNVGSGGVDDVLAKYSVTLGPRDEQNAYMAELKAIAMGACPMGSNIEISSLRYEIDRRYKRLRNPDSSQGKAPSGRSTDMRDDWKRVATPLKCARYRLQTSLSHWE
ncbi:hypothetical protein Forpi1262_v016750 [Fusarium oxysporum f. sp. raphani]|uniref:Uncharacterized protein n=1 Tax=Fusarium oxysporum f. sp. raphani TaxID=96318 RepID=A0A8J5TUN6_FUSOX|nr:hypothetical protein Forpi1262_v016750 [Fusarium oxysporum f. sp. raphani]